MEKQIEFRGQAIKYAVTGEGVPVVLVHGFTEDRFYWEATLQALEKKYCFIIPDLPGSGLSPFNPRLESLTDYADGIHEIISAEKLLRPSMIGHSMGGYIALAYAEKNPGILSRLGLFHSSPFADAVERVAIRNKSIASILRYGATPYVEQAIGGLFSEKTKTDHPEKISSLIQRYANFSGQVLVQYLSVMRDRPDRSETLKRFAGPVMLIAGEEDKSVPLPDSLRASYLADFTYFHILKNTAHMGNFEDPNLCSQILDRFLSSFSYPA